jgi:nickel/cobalt transporter (NicO) family protein
MNNQHRFVLTGVAAVVVVFLSDLALAQGVSFGAPHHASGIMPQSGVVAWIFAKQAAFYRSMSNFIRASKDGGAAIWDLFGISRSAVQVCGCAAGPRVRTNP